MSRGSIVAVLRELDAVAAPTDEPGAGAPVTAIGGSRSDSETERRKGPDAGHPRRCCDPTAQTSVYRSGRLSPDHDCFFFQSVVSIPSKPQLSSSTSSMTTWMCSGFLPSTSTSSFVTPEDESFELETASDRELPHVPTTWQIYRGDRPER